MADHVKKSGTIPKWNNVTKGFGHCSYDLYFKIMVIKHVEHTYSCEVGRKCSVF
jgi:hypothetical protein